MFNRGEKFRVDLLGDALEDHWFCRSASRHVGMVTKALGALGPEGKGRGSRRSNLARWEHYQRKSNTTLP